jgi:hypothetical protein
LGLLSLLVSVLNTTGTYFAWAKRAEGHRISSIQYARLYRFLNIEMSLPREERMTPADLLKHTKDQYDRLQEVSPLIPPEVIAVFKQRSDALAAKLKDVPAGSFTNAVHARIHEAVLSGVANHDVDGARRIVDDWTFPRTYLDFETIAFALPRWLGTKPWEQVPFQFSAHIEEREGQITHREFLSLNCIDPRRACAKALVAQIPQDGTIIAYNAAFERTCILRLAERFPDLAEDLKAIAARIVDLLPVTREHWYHRDQGGSWSIKAVLPTISNSGDYAMLDVSDGSAAQLAYLEAIAPATSEVRIAELAQSLRTYCAKDTYAMIEVLWHLIGAK